MKERGRIVALLVAAGSGTRAGGCTPKQYRRIAGKSLLAHAIAGLRHPLIDEIRVVIGPGQQPLYDDAAGSFGLPPPIVGGAERQQSVRNGLETIAEDGGTDLVLIHDAARPFLPPAVIERLATAAFEAGGAVPVLPVVDTLARNTASGRLGDTVDRNSLMQVQTPQAFRFPDILDAHRRWTAGIATDDAQIARAAGLPVATVEGDAMLEKLTYEEDFARAEQRLARFMVSRTGMGFDVHSFEPGDGVWMGGILIPHDKSLKGHSDADVVLHAITDALLGAIGEGDIGQHFPPSDPQWRGASSSRFVEHARGLIAARGGRIDHVDATIICEAPKIGPHREAIRASVAGLLRLPLGSVSIKATTTERLGFTGRGEGIAAQAIATLRVPEDNG
jgi:2-C-methyl-D-erythritol 4-phosphate cytidylyltransferase/2-C-methyl-D-erythritol 2,4-cyclodiphosphate synthase